MATTTALPRTSSTVNLSPFYGKQLRNFGIKAMLTLFTSILLFSYLIPFGNMLVVALSSQAQLSVAQNGPILPMTQASIDYQGKPAPIFRVTIDGVERELAQIKRTNAASQFIDPKDPEQKVIDWKGSWRTLPAVNALDLQWSNFQIAWERANFPRMFTNTLIIAVFGMIGTLLSCICVAYAFARFPIPGKNILFLVLIGTIILPTQVTLIPTFAFFSYIHWTNTFLPLIVPHFFANAYNVFLLRQYFLTLPRELDEAAMIDGAGPFKILTSVIIPQAWPAIISVAVFHFVWAWNDYFNPLIYLLGAPELQPISVGVQVFNFQYGPHPEWIQATSLMAMVLPLVIFFIAQRVFMRGVVITGVEK